MPDVVRKVLRVNRFIALTPPGAVISKDMPLEKWREAWDLRASARFAYFRLQRDSNANFE